MTTKYDYTEGATYQSEANPILIKNLPAGSSLRVSASYGEMLGELLFSIPANERHNKIVTIKGPACYSIIYDKSLASDTAGCLTYAGLCNGFTPMKSPNATVNDDSLDGTVNEGSWAVGNGTIFDSIEVGYLNGTTWVAQNKTSITGNTSYNYFTRIPKIYQKVTDLGNSKVQLDLALEPFDGATLHPAFIKDGVEKNHKYIGRYLGNVSSSKLRSVSGVSPTVSTTRATFRTYAKANGTGYNLMSYYDWDLVNKLYLLGFKDFNSQTALGAGATNLSSKINTGDSNHSWMYGKGSAGYHIHFLGIEDWWGNLWQFIDDFYGNSGVYYAGSNSTPTDNSSNKDNIGSFVGSSGSYPLKVQAGLNNFFLSEVTGGSASAGVCDYQYWDTGENLGCVGGHWYNDSYAGAFYLRASDSLSTSVSNIGARLTYCD